MQCKRLVKRGAISQDAWLIYARRIPRTLTADDCGSRFKTSIFPVWHPQAQLFKSGSSPTHCGFEKGFSLRDS
ncbi:hypothetical protein CHR29_17105 [Pseudomonas monteilii]|nr:hypothetical protein CHR29_17105 [Pseudomonas monteilii]